jgi:ABC-type nickel/cobalt efflux system permease component RcnA
MWRILIGASLLLVISTSACWRERHPDVVYVDHDHDRDHHDDHDHDHDHHDDYHH